MRLTSDVNTLIKRAQSELAREIRHPLKTYQICGELVGSLYNRDVVRSTVPDIDKLLGSVGLPLRTKLHIGGAFREEEALCEIHTTHNEDVFRAASFTSTKVKCLVSQEARDYRRLLQ